MMANEVLEQVLNQCKAGEEGSKKVLVSYLEGQRFPWTTIREYLLTSKEQLERYKEEDLYAFTLQTVYAWHVAQTFQQTADNREKELFAARLTRLFARWADGITDEISTNLAKGKP